MKLKIHSRLVGGTLTLTSSPEPVDYTIIAAWLETNTTYGTQLAVLCSRVHNGPVAKFLLPQVHIKIALAPTS